MPALTIRARYWLAHPQERVEVLERMEQWAREQGEEGAARRLGKLADYWQEMVEGRS
jgi:hypothetical protein